jgi:pyridoxine 5-phosphate synthase
MPDPKPVRLGVNIDHVATIRNARGGKHPDPLRAAHAAVLAGADGITVHLREDRRHIRDDDVARIVAGIEAPLNLELAATGEMLALALKTKPHAACIVPEKRTERTTEGGLEVAGAKALLQPMIAKLSDAGIRVSLFIEPDPKQIEAAAELKAPVIEIHTGAWCEAAISGDHAGAEKLFARIRDAAKQAASLGLEVHAGHGLDYETAERISSLPQIMELNIGHFIIGEALFEGMDIVIGEFRLAMQRGRAVAKSVA